MNSKRVVNGVIKLARKLLPLIIIFQFSCAKKNQQKTNFCGTLTLTESSIKCGTLAVPENHDNSKKSIHLSYVVIPAKIESSEPPILFLNGGPGGKSLTQLERWLNNPLRENHDIILFDQRGTGYSSPLPDVGPSLVEIIASDLTALDERPLVEDALREISNAMKDENIDASCYNVFQNAKDVVKLMEHLGYPEYSILGVSYGTKLGQLVAQSSNKVKSLILYGPAPIFVDFYGTVIPYFEQAVTDKSGLAGVLEKAAAKPFLITVKGRSYHLNPQDITMIARYVLYRPDGREVLASLVEAFGKNDTTAIRMLSEGPLTTILGSNFTSYLSSMLYDEYLDSSEKEYQEALANSTLKHGVALLNSYIKSLPRLHQGRAKQSEIGMKPISIPTLLMVNKFDPATPPDNVVKVKELIPNSTLSVFERGGHVVWDSLAFATVEAFLKTN